MDLNHARLPIPPLRHCLYVSNPAVGHGSRESLVFQTRGLLSIVRGFAYTETTSDSTICWEGFRTIMTEPTQATQQSSAPEIPEELALEIRKLAHDLSNALEIIVQTNYLLGTVELKEPASEWLRMLDSGVNRALEINLALRSYIKEHAPR